MNRRSPDGMIGNEGATRLRVVNDADVTRTVVEANRFATESGLTALDAQCVATAVSELARNILKYAGRGEILLKRIQCENSRGVVVTSRDNGPGIDDIEAAMQDHFSSSGTLGLGLPGVRRMMDEFAIESVPGKSTTVSCLKWDKPPRGIRNFLNQARGAGDAGAARRAGLPLDFATFSRPCRGEYLNGDLAMIEQRDPLMLLAVIDGLGHGPEAHRVACLARDHLKKYWTEDVVASIRHLHEALRGSLGAVAGIAVINTHTGEARFTGIGNIAYRLFGPRASRMVSMAGHLGHQIRTPQVQQHRLTDEDVVVMYSDGVRDRFDQEDYPQLRYQSAETIARTVVERFGKAHDDATCLALRIRQ